MTAVVGTRADVVALARTRRRRGYAIAIVVLAGLFVAGLTMGSFPIAPWEVPGVILDPDAGFGRRVVLEWRLPRTLAALAFGAALALSGAVFQTLSRNPLGSPDVIGFSTGAYTGAIVAVALAGQATLSVTGGALVGGLATAVVVYALAYKRGLSGFRLVVVGIGVTAMLHAVNTWLLLRLQPEVAMSAAIWGVGSLGGVTWSQLALAALPLAAAVGFLLIALPALRQLELGDDAARAHGLRLEPARLGILAIGVALTAIVTATTGPIAFVALTAPQIAKRLVGGSGLPLAASAIVGAALLLAADLVAQHALTDIPAGVVTVVLGGVYLVALLVREARRAW
ncbi:FecCD family ABC transporter permease [Agrococcus jejuensis]|uniref:Iron complex transport system permease protein n=1 Tax=Agrococcus jejuensis TaxID=399736 RepID=A0A1G8DTL4_9MICO|nr:iron chelate uptake ABC transporter family permease subunit [Agrococcus jejuensis]SDH61056.1 iron complex transport system permease protein [Agrococcus jejuensis]